MILEASGSLETKALEMQRELAVRNCSPFLKGQVKLENENEVSIWKQEEG